ncbi:MAG: PD-(D/E)XK nuclease family transposase [Candidatus Eremiobacteraeota bacterium]|nr:PD-(D/E)XK nuclease family transposase [Candidatus Eremiobacteraeota bacterium]
MVFKIVFGLPQNERLLRSLLNAVLELEDQDKILELEMANNEMSRSFVREKGAILLRFAELYGRGLESWKRVPDWRTRSRREWSRVSARDGRGVWLRARLKSLERCCHSGWMRRRFSKRREFASKPEAPVPSSLKKRGTVVDREPGPGCRRGRPATAGSCRW